jgi:ubiquinone/menaquinone biosynthesis C-methylase UbiE
MSADEHRQRSFESWQTMAAGWEKRRADIDRVTAPVREWLVGRLAPEPGDTVLELAAGPGDTGFSVASRLGEHGRLISTDFSPAMVEVARRRSAELGLSNVEHLVLNAESLDLEDDSVDGAICRFGYMLMPDRVAALAETRRVLRPDGRLALAVWRGPEQNPWVSIAGRVLVERGHAPPPDPGAPSMFTMADAEHTRSLLEEAGFDDVAIEDVAVVFTWRDVDDYVQSAMDTGGMFATAFGQAPEDEQQAMKDEFAEAFASYATEDGYQLPGLALVAVAR